MSCCYHLSHVQVSSAATSRSSNFKYLSFPERKNAFMEEARRLLETLKEQIYLYFMQEVYFQTWTLIDVSMVCYVHELGPQSFPISVFCS